MHHNQNRGVGGCRRAATVALKRAKRQEEQRRHYGELEESSRKQNLTPRYLNLKMNDIMLSTWYSLILYLANPSKSVGCCSTIRIVIIASRRCHRGIRPVSRGVINLRISCFQYRLRSLFFFSSSVSGVGLNNIRFLPQKNQPQNSMCILLIKQKRMRVPI